MKLKCILSLACLFSSMVLLGAISQRQEMKSESNSPLKAKHCFSLEENNPGVRTVESLTAEEVATSPVVSTSGSPKWYYLLSAAKERIKGDYAIIPEDLFPMYEKNIILYNSTRTEKYYPIQEASFCDNELFQLIEENGVTYFKNKATQGKMVNSWGSNEKGEAFTYTEMTNAPHQYYVKTNGRSCLWVNGDGQSLMANRYNSKGTPNSTNAWYFMAADDILAQLYMRMNQAKLLAQRLTPGVNPGEPVASPEMIAEFKREIEEIGTSTDLSQTTLDKLKQAIKKVTDEVVMPEEGKSYILRSASSPYDQRGYLLGINQSGLPACNDDAKLVSANYVWTISKTTNGTLLLKNYATGQQIQPVSTMNQAFKMGDKDVAVTFEHLGNKQFKIRGNGQVYHRSNVAEHLLFSWDGNMNSASAWYLDLITENELNKPLSIIDIQVKQGRTTTGIGNKDASILGINCFVSGFVGDAFIEEMTFTLEGTTRKEDIQKINIYTTTDLRRFRPELSAKIASTDATGTNQLTIKMNEPVALNSGENLFWVTFDVAENAQEGNLLDAQLISVKTKDNKVSVPQNGNPDFAATIFKSQSVVLTCGDYGSKYYRIPGIITADDGSLVTVCDRRIHSNVDLPAHIDLYVNRSTDGGKTWSEPVMVAGDEPGEIGYGDAAILKNKKGRLIILYNGGRYGLFNSTAENPFRKYKIYSDDNGVTWSEPEDITHALYGAGCTDPIAQEWTSMLLTSGRGICTRDGVLMVAVAAKVPGKSGFSNFAVVSYDDGDTWKTESANTAWDAGDEAKLAELNNGDILISMRRGGGREFNRSTDKGKTWGTHYTTADLKSPACNSSLLVYTAKADGYEKDRILHTVPYSNSRENVSLCLSYDEGKSFPIRKTICPGASAYSSLTILPDGSIGCLFEDGSSEMDMVFVNCSLEWLTDGKDSYQQASRGHIKISDVKTATYYDDRAYQMPKGLSGKIIVDVKQNQLITDTRYPEGDIVPACTGVILSGEPGDYEFTYVDSPLSSPADNLLRGSVYASPTIGGDLYYKLSLAEGSMDKSTLGFYYGAENGAPFMNAPHKAYLPLSRQQAQDIDIFYLDMASQTVDLCISDAGFATLMLPYEATLPEDVKAYSTSQAGEALVNGCRVLTLEEADALQANTPYIIEGMPGTYTFSGAVTNTQDTYTNGWLTGTFVGTQAQAGTYVLQNNNSITGFYRVTAGKEPYIGANRAWLTVPAEEGNTTEVTAFVFGDDSATGIEGMDATDKRVDVYTLEGVRVRTDVRMSEALKALPHSVYVVNGTKKAVK